MEGLESQLQQKQRDGAPASEKRKVRMLHLCRPQGLSEVQRHNSSAKLFVLSAQSQLNPECFPKSAVY